ncbi:MAG: FAD:protein FMN transferase [Pirellulaceae bacterium]
MSEPEKANSRRDFMTGQFGLRDDSKSPAEDSREPTPNVCSPLERKLLQHFTRRAMACDFQIFFELAGPQNHGEAAMKAFAEIEALENRLSVYRPESELSRLNREAAVADIEVSDEIAQLLSTALTISAETNGAFDLTATPLSRVWGFHDRRPQVPTTLALERARSLVNWRRVTFDRTTKTVRFGDAEIELNFNSIGKGFAVERAAAILTQLGYDRFVIHGGQSSVLARDAGPDAEGWLIGLTHPLIPGERIGEIRLQNESLSTSGTARQGIFHGGRRLGHVIDPRTGWPADHHLSVTVVHPDAAISDALATAFFVMTTEEVEKYCATHSETKALIFLPSTQSNRPWEIKCIGFPESQLKIYET